MWAVMYRFFHVHFSKITPKYAEEGQLSASERKIVSVNLAGKRMPVRTRKDHLDKL